ncbi:MAG: AAA family ATPase [Rhizobacter sp.]|nr:AAA family ATPase [Chlorobiales bacterium]
MLDGNWGCGKTWFIGRFQEEYDKSRFTAKDEKYESKFLYVSLYGVTALSEIDYKIFQQLHPVLGSKGAQFFTKVASSFLRTSFEIPFGIGKTQAELNEDVMGDFTKYLTNTENRVLIFDDLERCDLPINDVLGYMNTFVEQQELKVIIVANESEIQKTDSRYKIIKEKVIGQTFKVSLDSDSAFRDFVNEVKNDEAQRFLESQKEKILSVFESSGYKNLRHLRHSFLDFERFYNSIEKRFLDVPDLMEELLGWFLIFSTEIKSGHMSPSDIGNIASVKTDEIRARLSGKEPEPSSNRNIVEKYKLLTSRNTLLSPEVWEDFFEKGIAFPLRISESLGKSKYFQDQPEWMKLWYYHFLTDEEFEDAKTNVLNQLKNKQITIPEEILHVCSLLLDLSRKGLYERGVVEIVKDGKEIIEEIRKTKVWNNPTKIRIEQRASSGLAYADWGSSEFREIYSFLNQKLAQAHIDSANDPQAGKPPVEILATDPDKFITIMRDNYENVPVLSQISPEDFFESFINLSPENQQNVSSHLNKGRYCHPETIKELMSELDFLEKFKRLLQKKAEEKEGKLSGWQLNLQSEWIEDAVGRLKNVQTSGTQMTSK